jgi:hypothetical protein
LPREAAIISRSGWLAKENEQTFRMSL